MEWMEKKSTLRWFCHLERNKNYEFVKKAYVSEIECPRMRGRPVVSCKKDRMKEYIHERSADKGIGIDQARRV